MSYETFVNGSAPATPAAGKATVFVDSADRRIKLIDEKGVISPLLNWDWKENVLINGGYDLAQRQAPATLTAYSNTTGRTHAADRWAITNENLSTQYQRVDTGAAPETGITARYYGKYKKVTNAGKLVVSQIVEGTNSNPLRGRTVRLQAKMMRTVAGSMTVRLGLLYITSAGTLDGPPATFVSAFGGAGTDPTWGTNITALAPVTVDGGTTTGLGMDCVLTGAWVRYSASFSVPSNAKNIIPAIWTNGQLAINDELNMTECGLFDGAEILDWTPRPINQEIALCQRFYCKSFGVNVAPAQNAGLAGSLRFPCTTALAVANSIVGSWRFPVEMFNVVTAVFYNPSAANAFARNVTLGTDATATSIVNAGLAGGHINCTGLAAWAVGNDIAVHLSLEGEV